ncbi:MAG: MarC family protein [Candidatus Micrarchaeota archaeon]|nr:MarC family protein [Candidatus Micrarchaeota archaeon]
MDELTAFFITCFISVLAITNPLSTIPLFLSIMKNEPPQERRKTAFRVGLVAFVVLLFFSLTGFLLFQVYSITIEAFRIAGGVLIFMIGMRMLFPSAQPHTAQHVASQAYLVPLAIPMTSGPGAITTVVVLASQAKNFWLELALWIAIFLACFTNYLVLRYSEIINRRLGEEGMGAMIRIMGLIVCSIGVQFIINGLKAAFPVLA